MAPQFLSLYASDDEAQCDWDFAHRLADEGRDEDARPIFLRLWESGYPDAAHDLGAIEERKAGDVARNLSEAENWYRRALEIANDDAAKLNIARIIFLRHRMDPGASSTERLEFATQLLDELCEKRIPQAAVFLGSRLLSGDPLPIDEEKAERLLRIGAEHGYVAAFMLLTRLSFQRRCYLRAATYWCKMLLAFIALSGSRRDAKLLGVVKR